MLVGRKKNVGWKDKLFFKLSNDNVSCDMLSKTLYTKCNSYSLGDMSTSNGKWRKKKFKI